MIVTIDGPAGAGKSTAARRLAERLGFVFLDTGALYRAVALAARRAGLDRDAAEPALEGLLATLHIDYELGPGRVSLGGEDVTGPIRAPEVTALTGRVADSPAVRARLTALQRQVAAAAAGRPLVTEGRDQGTLVFPDAACKFFLTADPQERARRRHAELVRRGPDVPLAEVRAAQDERDARDTARAIAPLVPAGDAIHVDTTGLGVDAVVDLLEGHVRRRL